MDSTASLWDFFLSNERTKRLPLLVNLLIALLGFALLARITHFSTRGFNEHQSFALGFSLGLIVAGAFSLHLKPGRSVIGFLLGIIGVGVFALALFGGL